MRLAGRIHRRLLVNWRVDPAAVAPLLPDGLRPQLVDGSAVAGICVLRVTAVRPAALPLPDPLAVVSSAHRVAVEWDGPAGAERGVFVAARHTRSPSAALLGGRVVPGVQRLASIAWRAGSVESVVLRADGGRADLEVAATDHAVSGLFGDDLGAASEFFRAGEIAWSADRTGAPEPLRMRTLDQRFEPLTVLSASSSWIDSFPPGSASLDSAFVMHDVRVEWDRPALALEGSVAIAR